MIGAIADDFTGATDIAVAFRRAGLRTGVVFDIEQDVEVEAIDVLIVALKSRTIPAADAVARSIEAAAWLLHRGATQLFFKYCSTFDSRPEGNIGPVADALAGLVGAHRVVFVPSSPEHLRTQYMGRLFVDELLLSESPMRHHPLTPMTDSSIPRLLAAQTPTPVRLIDEREVRGGSATIRARLDALAGADRTFVVVDALDDGDLAEIGEAIVDDAIVTGAAGLAGGLGRARAGRLGRSSSDERGDVPSTGRAVVLAGSCSARTREQVARMWAAGRPVLQLDPVSVPDSAELAGRALAWFDRLATTASPLISSSMPPDELLTTQRILGVQRASDLLEQAMGLIAEGLRQRGVTRILIAGGETSGAVVTALGVGTALVGVEAAPGVPWITTGGAHPIALLLKSGNFGDPDLLVRASEEHLRIRS